MHKNLSIAVGAALVMALAGCADDSEPAGAAITAAPDRATTEAPVGTSAASPGSAADDSAGASDELCALVSELFELEGFPSVEQLQRYQQLAPTSIAEAVGTVTEPLIAVGGDLVESFNVLADDEVEAAEAEMLAFEQNRCGSGHSDYMPLPAGATREIEPAAVRVDVHATEYAFQIGDVAPGRTSFVLVNDGAEAHVLEIIKLADGVTFDDVLATEDHETTIAGLWETGLAAPGGDEEAVTFDLEPGNYALACYIPAADGTAHLSLGMQHEFTVH